MASQESAPPPSPPEPVALAHTQSRSAAGPKPLSVIIPKADPRGQDMREHEAAVAVARAPGSARKLASVGQHVEAAHAGNPSAGHVFNTEPTAVGLHHTQSRPGATPHVFSAPIPKANPRGSELRQWQLQMEANRSGRASESVVAGYIRQAHQGSMPSKAGFLASGGALTQPTQCPVPVRVNGARLAVAGCNTLPSQPFILGGPPTAI
jgi:hypothetical protein